MIDDKIKKLKRLLRSNPRKGLAAVRDFIQEYKELTAAEKEEFKRAVKELETSALTVWRKVFLNDTDAPQRVADAVAKSASNLFESGGLGVSSQKAVNKVLDLIKDGNTDDAVKAIKRAANTVHYRAATIVNTLQIGKSRATAFDMAVANGAKRAKYVGAKLNARPACLKRLNNTYTIAEIEAMPDEQGLAVKDFCGGHNCKHRWLFIV